MLLLGELFLCEVFKFLLGQGELFLRLRGPAMFRLPDSPAQQLPPEIRIKLVRIDVYAKNKNDNEQILPVPRLRASAPAAAAVAAGLDACREAGAAPVADAPDACREAAAAPVAENPDACREAAAVARASATAAAVTFKLDSDSRATE